MVVLLTSWKTQHVLLSNKELNNNDDTLEILLVLSNPQHIVFVVDEE